VARGRNDMCKDDKWMFFLGALLPSNSFSMPLINEFAMILIWAISFVVCSEFFTKQDMTWIYWMLGSQDM